MSYSDGKAFSTKDKDNSYNCATKCVGAWWYEDCAYSNLNGEYLNGKHEENNAHRGVSWHYWKGWYYSLKASTMMLR